MASLRWEPGGKEPHALGRILLGWAVCLPGGFIFEALGTVLPWMLGPLFFMAAASIAGLPVKVARGGLQAGQVMVGVALGLYFTPSVLALVGVNLPYVLAGAVFSIVIGMICARCLSFLSGSDSTTSFFACLPGGAADMTVLADHYGGRGDRVAAAHVVRLVSVMVVVPTLITASGAHGAEVWVAAVSHIDAPGLVLAVLLSASVSILFYMLNFPNAWIIGAVAASAALTGLGIELSSVPRPLLNFAQLLCGCALGSRFTMAFLRRAPRFLGWVAVTVTLAMALLTGFAWVLYKLSGIEWATLALANAPGGITEMAVTAKLLQLGVPIVTAFHVARMGLIVFAAAPVFVWRQRLVKALGAAQG